MEPALGARSSRREFGWWDELARILGLRRGRDGSLNASIAGVAEDAQSAIEMDGVAGDAQSARLVRYFPRAAPSASSPGRSSSRRTSHFGPRQHSLSPKNRVRRTPTGLKVRALRLAFGARVTEVNAPER